MKNKALIDGLEEVFKQHEARLDYRFAPRTPEERDRDNARIWELSLKWLARMSDEQRARFLEELRLQVENDVKEYQELQAKNERYRR